MMWLDIEIKMKKRDSELLVKDFKKTVQLHHKDGSIFYLPLAYVEEEDGIYYIYTEHCGRFWFDKEDLEYIVIE